MARLARVVVPGLPHHVTQRGNRREPIFLEDGDQEVYIRLLAERARKAGVEIWAYCLMPNHVHLIMVPRTPDGLRAAIAEAHRRYTRFVNERAGLTGHLFQGRFASVVMDEDHLLAAARYVALNPVRARLVKRAEAWPWSSVAAHLAGRDDRLVTVRPLLDRIPDFAAMLRTNADDPAFEPLRAAERTGRPLGSRAFIARLERKLMRDLAPRKRGRPRADDKARAKPGRRRSHRPVRA